MRILTVKTRYLKLILARWKIQTIRKNNSYYEKIKPGDIGWVTDYRKKLKIRVTETWVKKRHELTEEDAILDGLFSLSELMALVPYDEVKLIRFELVSV